jgi:glutathione S-transferase
VELRRAEGDRHPDVIERQARAVEAGLDQAMRLVNPDRFAIGEIALIAALGYLDFRLGHEDWRKGRDALAAWAAAQEKRPSVAGTRPG